MTSLIDLAVEAGVLDERTHSVNPWCGYNNIMAFGEAVKAACLKAIQDEVNNFDLSSRAEGIRVARDAIIKEISL